MAASEREGNILGTRKENKRTIEAMDMIVMIRKTNSQAGDGGRGTIQTGVLELGRQIMRNPVFLDHYTESRMDEIPDGIDGGCNYMS